MRLLIVCTGNICRSPLGEVVVRRALASAGLAATVASAGTWDGMAGEPADPRAVVAAARRGYDLRPFCARVVRRFDFVQFDLMLGMTRDHVEELEALRRRNDTAVVRRYLDLTPDLAVRDIADPYLGADADFEAVLDQLEQGVPGIVEFVRARP